LSNRTWGLRLALPASVVAVGAAAVLATVAAPAGAAASLPTPESLTSCGGILAADAAGTSQGQPNLLDYRFDCSTPISAYTITVDRVPGARANVDNFEASPTAITQSGSPSTTESITCEGTTPSNGINCNLGAGGFLNAYDAASGSIDLVAPYCAYLPPKAKAGTPAVPRAIVSVVVTDNTGAEDGPFYLAMTPACKKVPAVVPATTTAAGKKSKKKH